jgi:hypothetical protein
MESIAKDSLALIQFLLPGFLAAWVFYSLTPYAKPSQFERVVQALIFTLFVQASVYLVKWISFSLSRYISFGSWSQESELIWSILCGLTVGLAFSAFANNDAFHRLLRWGGITKETSYASEWYSAFCSNITYVVLHLNDERRAYGWPIEWPSEPMQGHFLLAHPSWIVDGKDLPITGASKLMIAAKDVMWVEFVDCPKEQSYDQEGLKSATSEKPRNKRRA